MHAIPEWWAVTSERKGNVDFFKFGDDTLKILESAFVQSKEKHNWEPHKLFLRKKRKV